MNNISFVDVITFENKKPINSIISSSTVGLVDYICVNEKMALNVVVCVLYVLYG